MPALLLWDLSPLQGFYTRFPPLGSLPSFPSKFLFFPPVSVLMTLPGPFKPFPNLSP